MDYNKIAIADVLKHPELGIISHQPDIHSPLTDKIRVRGLEDKVLFVLASECEPASSEESEDYWKNIKW